MSVLTSIKIYLYNIPLTFSAVDLFGSPPFNVETSPAANPAQPPAGLTSPVAPPPTNKASYRANPFNSGGSDGEDPFGMGSFNPTSPTSAADLDKQIQKVDQELLDLQVGELFCLHSVICVK